jgi:hypothetical protein
LCGAPSTEISSIITLVSAKLPFDVATKIGSRAAAEHYSSGRCRNTAILA